MAAHAASFQLVFRNNRAKARALLFRHIGLLESYFDGDLDVQGDLRAPLRDGMQGGRERPNWLVALRNQLHEWRHSNRTWEQARANACFHYGLGTEFYRLWLDTELMMYTCGYWKDGTRTVEEAQRDKVEHVCRKVMLQPGESVIDVGCGFGGFMFHAHEHHGVDVTGLNVTPEQNAMVRAEIERRGLGRSLSVVETDFRDAFREFDKVVSIGVLEHAGRDQLAEVVRAHARFLKPGGLGMLHFIGHVGRRPTEYFIREFVFPGGWIPSLADVIVAMEDAGLEVIDIENLRRHYALTLDAWAERFDANWQAIHALDPKRFDERFRRIWRTYLLGCAEMFRLPNGRTHLFQILFSRGNVSLANFPRSREYMYAPRDREPRVRLVQSGDE
ncbi:MAG TPA: cyclopropane-fatty-acyl-phospholipid synthase family protein [Usitatibacter sp.]|jgi:cyclopropane-fatty-acyl-phospholipid synthase|nr:cyclopropane-fatty-acyl-phospholipid synthase family protein [Usitatibacter sp.]